MTFCFVFRAHDRGGVGIVSDRRTSWLTTFGDVNVESDEATKVFQLTETSGLAVAGNLGLLDILMCGLAPVVKEARSEQRIEQVTKHLGHRYQEAIQSDPAFRDPAIRASFIFFDTFRSRSSQRYRIARLTFSFNATEKRAEVARTTGKQVDWLTIGATESLRTHLGRLGATALSELANREAIYRTASTIEVSRLKAIHKVDSSAQVLILDSTGGAPLARATSRFQRGQIGEHAPAYTDFLAMAASAAIQKGVEEMHRVSCPWSDTISQNLHVGVFEADRGLRLLSVG